MMWKTIAIAMSLLVGACAYIEQGDADQVSILSNIYTKYGPVLAEAQKHCGRYGKKAVVNGRFSSEITIFKCVKPEA